MKETDGFFSLKYLFSLWLFFFFNIHDTDLYFRTVIFMHPGNVISGFILPPQIKLDKDCIEHCTYHSAHIE